MSDHDLDVEEELLGEGKVRCEACPIRCFIKPEQTGSCDRYGNVDGVLTRMDPVTVLHITNKRGGSVVPFALNAESWSGEASISPEIVIIGSGSGTTYPDYKPAPFMTPSPW
jgi:6-hydroxynicotinate reductase